MFDQDRVFDESPDEPLELTVTSKGVGHALPASNESQGGGGSSSTLSSSLCCSFHL